MIRSKKTTRPIGFLSIFIGMLFFFNPSFGVVDVLPDFIGCLFIYLGLSRISVISRIMAEARTAFLKLLAVCLLKDIAVVVVLGMSTNAERPTSLLIVGFAAAAASIYFAFCAFGSLFDGFYSLGVSNDCASLYTRYRQHSFFGRKGME